jgi:RNA polymerase sigma-70 factor (ECF subfamily)
MLGGVTDAEDVVQDAWLRWDAAEQSALRNAEAWLVTVTTRLAIDRLRHLQSGRETYVGPWLPEPLVAEVDADPADRVSLDEEVSMALMVVLERLTPAERTAYLLHDVFHLSFAEVAEVVGRSPAAVRQLASRARAHVDEGRPRFPADRAEQERVVGAFARAAMEGDVEALAAVLDPDVVWRSDGGGKVLAAQRPQRGARHVARAFAALARKGGPARGARLAMVNGAVGIVLEDGAGILQVMSFTVDGGRITAIDIVRNPDKLSRVPAP